MLHNSVLQDDNLLIFLHIPKTAGTSLLSRLSDNFRPKEIAPFHTGAVPVRETEHQIRGSSTEELARYRLLATHLDYGVHRLFPQRSFYITMLRDPVERVISNYRHLKQYQTRLYEIVKDMSFEDFLRSPATRDQYFNRQATQIAGVTNVDPADFQADEALTLARKHLQEFLFVGVKERFDTSIRLLNDALGWPPDHGYETLNVSDRPTSRSDVSPGVLDLIVDRNTLDIELYDYAQRLFDERVARMLDALLEKEAELRAVYEGRAWRLISRIKELRRRLLP